MKAPIYLSTLPLSLCASVNPKPTPNNHTLLNVAAPSSCLNNPSITTNTIQFDDLPTHLGLGPLPTPHHHLLFSSFSIMRPHHPALKKLISPNDLNCAVSAPNALVGSRLPKDVSAASFEIANATEMGEQGLAPGFTLHGFSIKPMDAPEPGTDIVVKGHRVSEGVDGRDGKSEILEWSVFFPSGFHDPFEVKIAEFSRQAWSRLTKVEIHADFGYDGLDWEFCIDDLHVAFSKTVERGQREDTGRQAENQNVLDIVEL